MSATVYPFPRDRQREERLSNRREDRGAKDRELLRQVDALVGAYLPIVYAELATILAERK